MLYGAEVTNVVDICCIGSTKIHADKNGDLSLLCFGFVFSMKTGPTEWSTIKYCLRELGKTMEMGKGLMS